MLGLFAPGDLKHTRFYQEIREEVRAEAKAAEREHLLPLVIAVFLEHGVTVEEIAVKMETDLATIKRIVQQQKQRALLNQLEA